MSCHNNYIVMNIWYTHGRNEMHTSLIVQAGPVMSDELLAEKLCSMSIAFHDLSSVGIFNSMIVQFARWLQYEYGVVVTMDRVKRWVDKLKKRFMIS